VHHGIRGPEADGDEEFVRRLAADRGAECLFARGDARGEARERGLSPEAAARSLRFRHFRRWAAEHDLDLVLLGQHLDDQAETVLLRALRGAGIRGLAGMRAARPLRRAGGSTLLARPLLTWRRRDLLAFLDERGQPYRRDSTNNDTSIPRNLLRRTVLPLLERRVQSGAVRSLARLGGIAGKVSRDLRLLGHRALGQAGASGPGGSICLSVEALRAWPPSVIREAVSLALERLETGAPHRSPGRSLADIPLEAGGGRVFPRSVLDSVVGWLESGAPSVARIDFGSGADPVTIELRYGVLRLQGRGRSEPEVQVPVPVPGGSRVRWMDWELRLEEFEAKEVPASSGFSREADKGNTTDEPSEFLELVDADRLREAGALRLRQRRPGDRFQPLGGPGGKSLKAFLRERRVWPSERDRVPLLVAGEVIVWVVGHRIDERFKVRPETRRVLRLWARRGGGSPPP
jgi:tRNA(Ile)-lysidine synthase